MEMLRDEEDSAVFVYGMIEGGNEKGACLAPSSGSAG
jgi:hypothetical protein